jgi:hypothetical protein
MKLRVAGSGGRRAWDVEVNVNEYGDMYLGRGWREFVSANGLELGQLLVFRYDGAALLSVTVFEESECRRPCQQQEEEEEQEEEEDDDDDSDEEEEEDDDNEEEEDDDDNEDDDDDDYDYEGAGTLLSLAKFPFWYLVFSVNSVCGRTKRREFSAGDAGAGADRQWKQPQRHGGGGHRPGVVAVQRDAKKVPPWQGSAAVPGELCSSASTEFAKLPAKPWTE